MPAIRVDLARGHSETALHRVRDLLKQAVAKTLAPEESRYDYIAINEVVARTGDGAPLVSVDLRPGREAWRKTAFVEAVASVLEAELGISPSDLYVVFRESGGENHYCGGIPLPPWQPAAS